MKIRILLCLVMCMLCVPQLDTDAQVVIDPFTSFGEVSTFPSPFEDWSFRRKITIDNTKVASTLTNFPVLVPLSLFVSDFFTKLNTDGTDIRFASSDASTQIPRENLFTNTGAETGEIYVKVASISSSVDTDFYIYYGNSGASEPAKDATFGAENAWDSDFRAVWHMQEDPSGTPPQILDSTSSDFDGTSSGTMVGGDSVIGDIIDGRALDFDGADDHIDMGATVGDISTSDHTLTYYFRPSSVSVGRPLIATQEGGAGAFHGFNFAQSSAKILIIAKATNSDTNVLNFSTTSNVLSFLVWTQVSWVKEGSAVADQTIYVDNGTAESLSTTTDTLTSADFDSNFNFTIAERGFGDNFQGRGDEVRWSTVARAAGWISSTFNSLNDPGAFLTIGSEETP